MKEIMRNTENENEVIKYKDPVCGKWLSLQEAKVSVPYKGENYYFCSQSCATKFNVDSEKYLSHFSREKELHQPMNEKSMSMRNMNHHSCCGRGE